MAAWPLAIKRLPCSPLLFFLAAPPPSPGASLWGKCQLIKVYMIDLSHPHLGPSHSILQSTHELRSYFRLRVCCRNTYYMHTWAHTKYRPAWPLICQILPGSYRAVDSVRGDINCLMLRIHIQLAVSVDNHEDDMCQLQCYSFHTVVVQISTFMSRCHRWNVRWNCLYSVITNQATLKTHTSGSFRIASQLHHPF